MLAYPKNCSFPYLIYNQPLIKITLLKNELYNHIFVKGFSMHFKKKLTGGIFPFFVVLIYLITLNSLEVQAVFGDINHPNRKNYQPDKCKQGQTKKIQSNFFHFKIPMLSDKCLQDKQGKRFKCTKCDATYLLPQSLKRHEIHKHSPGDCNTDEQSLKISTKNDDVIIDSQSESLSPHPSKIVITSNKNKRKFKCDECGGYYSSKESLYHHRRLKHLPCNQEMKNHYELCKHKRTCLICKEYDELSKKKKKLECQVSAAQIQKKCTCGQCSKIFLSLQALRLHQRLKHRVCGVKGLLVNSQLNGHKVNCLMCTIYDALVLSKRKIIYKNVHAYRDHIKQQNEEPAGLSVQKLQHLFTDELNATILLSEGDITSQNFNQCIKMLEILCPLIISNIKDDLSIVDSNTDSDENINTDDLADDNIPATAIKINVLINLLHHLDAEITANKNQVRIEKILTQLIFIESARTVRYSTSEVSTLFQNQIAAVCNDFAEVFESWQLVSKNQITDLSKNHYFGLSHSLKSHIKPFSDDSEIQPEDIGEALYDEMAILPVDNQMMQLITELPETYDACIKALNESD